MANLENDKFYNTATGILGNKRETMLDNCLHRRVRVNCIKIINYEI